MPQSFAPGALLDAGLRRGEEPRAQAEGLAAPETRELPGLEHPDEQPLCGRRQVLELVYEERPAARFLEHPRHLLAARLLAPEEAALGVGLAQARGDQGHERGAGARALLVDVARKGLAPGSGLPHQQHGGSVGRHLLQLCPQLLHEAALADRHRVRRAEEPPRLAVAPAGIEGALHRSHPPRYAPRRPTAPPPAVRVLAFTGSTTRTRAPPSGRLSASILPPCSSMIFFTMASPSPVPFGLVVT